MYLMIKNPGVAHVSQFTLLGVSSSRGDESKIGQFGSGSKHGLLTLLRLNLDTVVYLGSQRLTFDTVLETAGNTSFNRVRAIVDREIQPLSYTLGFGELDWNSIHMGMREFISNALDAVDGDIKQITFQMVEKPFPVVDATAVFIEAHKEVVAYYRNIGNYFKQFVGDNDKKVIKKAKPSPCRVFRKGVFVRELSTESLFDYNFGPEVQIDESRNLDEFAAKEYAAQYTLNHAPMSELLKVGVEQEELLESKINQYSRLSEERTDSLKACWKAAYGDALIAGPLDGEYANKAMAKGIKVVVPKSGAWRSILERHGIGTVRKAFVNEGLGEIQGNTVVEPTDGMRRIFERVWEILRTEGMTRGRRRPGLKAFKTVSDGGMNSGFYKDGIVYINIESESAYATYIEEIAHHITGASDFTRDFQDFAFVLAGRLMAKELVCTVE